MKILLTGGSGLLGTELQKINNNIESPSHEELDVVNYGRFDNYVKLINPDVIIHCAAVKDNRAIEKNPVDAIRSNIVGTANMAQICYERGIRLVYLSTDYIYNGDHGQCKETDPIQPFNQYAWTKLGGECSVRMLQNHLIIRTSFGSHEFPYKEAFTDKWSSKDYVDVIAPMIYEAALSPLTGILNLGTQRKSLYSYASQRNEVIPIKVEERYFNTPYDTSMNMQKWDDYKQSNAIAKSHTNCRVCGSDKLTKYLDLGLTPLANNLEYTSQRAKDKERFPLQVLFCEDCGLSQLGVVIDPAKMFSNYAYRSSVNKPYIDHCRDMCVELTDKYGLTKDSFHIDIAGNDGALLAAFKETLNHSVLDVDPAENLTAIAEANGIRSRTDFWSLDLAETITESLGKADLITATNVFAHLDNVREFMQGCKLALSEKGVLIIENPYLIDFIENMEFDTVYHEHVTYWSVTPMVRLCDELGMELIDCSKQSIHGGSMRYTIAHKGAHEITTAIDHCIRIEEPYTHLLKYKEWQGQVKESIADFQIQMLNLKRDGKKIVAFGASAKGNTLLNCAKMNTDIIDYIMDETPEKVGKFHPGTGIPIVNKQVLSKDNPDYIVILAWNFADVIMAKLRDMGFDGEFIIPIPKFEIIKRSGSV